MSQRIAIEEVKPSKFNPPDRAENVIDLVESMKADGFWPWQPILVGSDGIVGDGHRRLAAAKAAGLSHVYVEIVADKTADDIWAINSLRRNLMAKDYAYAYASGIDRRALEAIKVHPLRDIRQLADIGGDDLLLKIVSTKTSPHVLTVARSVATYCGMTRDREFLARTVNWLIDHKMQQVVRIYIRSELDPMFLRRCILDNVPIKITADIVRG